MVVHLFVVANTVSLVLPWSYTTVNRRFDSYYTLVVVTNRNSTRRMFLWLVALAAFLLVSQSYSLRSLQSYRRHSSIGVSKLSANSAATSDCASGLKVNKLICAAAGLFFVGLPFQQPQHVQATIAASRTINSLEEFLRLLDDGSMAKVVFDGVNPKFATVTFKTGEVALFGEAQGFPSFDDPVSPSGPTQLIAR